MPQVTRYEQQVQRTGTTQQDFRAADFGEGIGAGIKEAGRGIGTIAEADAQIAEIRRTQLVTELGTRFAEATLGLDETALTMRSEAARGGAGHRDAVNARITGTEEEFLQGIQDRDVQALFRQRFANYRATRVSQEHTWEVARRSEFLAENVEQAGNVIANRVAIDPTPENLEQAFVDIEAQAASIPNEDARATIVRSQKREATVAWANALNQTGRHEELLAVLEGGGLGNILEDGDLTTLRSGALVERNRAETRARAVRAEQEGAARDEIRLFTARIEAGDEPTDEEFTRIEGLAQQFGLTVEEFNVGVRRNEVRINRLTRDWTGPDFEREIGALRAKGDDRTTDENITLAQLERIAAARIQENANNPHGRAARMGNQPPPIDLQRPDRAAVNSRIAWAESYARENGLALPPYFSPAEVTALQERYRGGTAARLDLAGWLRGTLGSDRAEMAARQIAPNDEGLRIQVRLAPPFANLYGRGREALGRPNNGLLAPNNDVRRFGADDARRVLGEVQAAIPQDLRSAYYDAALHIAAGMADGTNQPINEDIFRMALHRAAGATGMPGQLRGGLAWRHNEPIWLPENMSAADLEQKIARAGPDHWARANRDSQGNIGSGIFFRGQGGGLGRAATLGEARSMRFQTVRPGVYRVIGPQGGVMLNRRGEPYELDVRLLP